jgi:hypothetical protein
MIRGYANLFHPLEKLRSQKTITWTTEYQSIYDKAFKILSSELILSYPDFENDFKVATDASNHGLGAVLYQEKDGKKHYISFASRALTDSEKGYGATKRELMGVIFALRKFRYYLFGKHFKLYTDHKALTYLHTQKQTNQMLQHWLEELLELDFEVIHLPGIMNILPDALSRLYADDSIPQFSNIIVQETLDVNQEETSTELREQLLTRAHLMGHFGQEAMVAAIMEQGHFWLTLKQEALEMVKSCIPCQRFNISKMGFHPLKTISAALPLDHLAIDLKEYQTSAAGNKYCLVIIDICTRFVWLHALPNKEAITIAKGL